MGRHTLYLWSPSYVPSKRSEIRKDDLREGRERNLTSDKRRLKGWKK